MGQPVLQASFNSGEWAPNLYGRVDLAKYHSGAALLRNFFVDYRGGATTRPGTKYVLQARNATCRLIPFTASFTVTYLLEFGPGYIRFFTNGQPVLENATTISAQTPGSPVVFTDTGHGYANGDWIFVGNAYYIVGNVTTNTFTLTDLLGNPVNVNPFTLPASAQRVFTLLNSPYQAADLPLIKFAQNVNQLYLCHPNYPPQVLTLNSATNWTLAAINFVPTIASPVITSIAVNGTASTVTVSYVVTAVDSNGQESSPSVPAQVNNTNGAATTQTITWNTIPGAVSYNVYKAIPSLTTVIPGGIPYAFVGTATSTRFIDTGISPDFSECAPVPTNPFAGAGVATVTITTAGNNYTVVPTVTFSAPGGGGITAAGYVTNMTVITNSLNTSVQGFAVGSTYAATGFSGVTIFITGVDAHGFLTSYILSVNQIFNGTGATLPSTFSFINAIGRTGIINVTWGVAAVTLTNPGTGYAAPPTVAFSGGHGAAATTTLGASSNGNPLVPMMIQQRLFLGGQALSPAEFNMSQPGAPFNFNVSFPLTPDSAINETLTSSTLHTIKAALPVSAGLAIFTDKAAWLLNGGQNGAPFSATSLVANPQGYSGCGDVSPIATPNDILYVQAKNSIVRDLSYNFYLANYVGADISILASHLFYSFQIVPNWAFAEEPFKLVWAVRNDGIMLCLTYAKEQELIAWTHHDTQGDYISVASINESTGIGNVDATYVAVSRTVQGQSVTYIERMVELVYPADFISSWQVDAGIGYNGTAATTFSGAQHLSGMVVTGLADGIVINFTMPVSGTFVFGPGGTTGLTGIPSASVVTVGLAFLPQLQTLPLDTGEPTIQGKRKKISGVSLKVNQTLGLSMGSTFATAVPLQDLILGNVGSGTNTVTTGLVSGVVRGYMDPNWTVPGQYCIQQNQPYPATILAVIPEIDIGDTAR